MQRNRRRGGPVLIDIDESLTMLAFATMLCDIKMRAKQQICASLRVVVSRAPFFA